MRLKLNISFHFGFSNGMTTFMGYLMPKPSFKKDGCGPI